MNKKNQVITTLGGHSALEICLGAKKQGLGTLLVLQKGREQTYLKYYHNLVDDYILVDHFKELTEKTVINKLQETKAIFIPHRYCQVYCDLAKLETEFPIPVFGNKKLLKYEERSGEYTQYKLLDSAKIDYPRRITDPRDIDRLVLVKVKEAQRNYERAFFFALNYRDYKEKSLELIRSGKINEADLKEAIIEEYLLGTQVNFNFFYSPIYKRLEMLGTDMRRQTNIDGLIRLPANQQIELLRMVSPSYIENGHTAVTVKESLLEGAFDIASRLIDSLSVFMAPGLIGPFALQTAVIAGPPKEKIIVYDLSLRMPGSPGTSFTPYSQYLWGRSVSFGERIAIEITEANKKRLYKELYS